MEQPKVAARCLVFSSVILIGTNMDLAKFTLRPLAPTKEFNRAFKKKSCLTLP
jgi:hypothetical protein